MNKRAVGENYERKAEEYLLRDGYEIVDRNYHAHRVGEVDLVAKKDDLYVFVEVKYRSGTEYGLAVEAVDFRKQKQISRVSEYYLSEHGLHGKVFVRYDVIGFQGEEINWIQNAFPYAGRK